LRLLLLDVKSTNARALCVVLYNIDLQNLLWNPQHTIISTGRFLGKWADTDGLDSKIWYLFRTPVTLVQANPVLQIAISAPHRPYKKPGLGWPGTRPRGTSGLVGLVGLVGVRPRAYCSVADN
jgi:hypothetical protein